MSKQIQTIILKKVRVSFPHLETPREGTNGGKAKYEVTALIPKSRDITDIKKAVFAAKVAKWGADKTQWKKIKVPTIIQDGDEKQDVAGYAGHYYIKATSTSKPGCIDLKGKDIDPTEIYAGCFADIAINIGAYEFKEDKLVVRGVSAYVEGVRLNNADKGEAFSSKKSARQAFGMSEDEEESDDSDDMDDEEDEEEDLPPKKKGKSKPPVDDDADDDGYDD